MKKTIISSICSVAIICASFSISNAQSIMEKYDQETIYLSGGKYIKNGVKYPMGFYFSKLKKEMAISPNAVIEWGQFEKSRNAYLILSLAGLAALTTGAVFGENDEDLQTGFFLASSGLVLASIPFAVQSQKRLHKAVWLRNRDVLE